MSKIVNNPTINDSEVVNEIRSAIEHRATWMYYLMDEARKEGLDWEGFARRAITRCGCLHGANFLKKTENGTLPEFEQVFGVGNTAKVFEMEILQADAEKYYIDFHYCPLVTGWLKAGASEEDIEHLCDIAMDGDRGVTSCFKDFGFTLGDTIAQGHPVCQIRFDKK